MQIKWVDDEYGGSNSDRYSIIKAGEYSEGLTYTVLDDYLKDDYYVHVIGHSNSLNGAKLLTQNYEDDV